CLLADGAWAPSPRVLLVMGCLLVWYRVLWLIWGQALGHELAGSNDGIDHRHSQPALQRLCALSQWATADDDGASTVLFDTCHDTVGQFLILTFRGLGQIQGGGRGQAQAGELVAPAVALYLVQNGLLQAGCRGGNAKRAACSGGLHHGSLAYADDGHRYVLSQDLQAGITKSTDDDAISVLCLCQHQRVPGHGGGLLQLLHFGQHARSFGGSQPTDLDIVALQALEASLGKGNHHVGGGTGSIGVDEQYGMRHKYRGRRNAAYQVNQVSRGRPKVSGANCRTAAKVTYMPAIKVNMPATP